MICRPDKAGRHERGKSMAKIMISALDEQVVFLAPRLMSKF
jgi:hypothetical protein